MPVIKVSCKFTFISCLCFTVFYMQHISAQNTYLPLNSYSYHLIDRSNILRTDSSGLHTSVKPFNRKEVFHSAYTLDNDKRAIANSEYLFADNSEFSDDAHSDTGRLLHIFYRDPDALYSVFKKDFFLKLNPVIHTEFGFSTDTSELKFINSRGVELRGGIDDKVGFYFYATDNQARFPAYIQNRTALQNSVLNGEGTTKVFKGNGVDYLSARGYIDIQFTKHIGAQFGQDKIFIGDGMRSLIWSENSKDFLFLKLNTHVWKIHYQNIFAQLANYNSGYIYDSLIEKKYAAMHHLSVNITEKLNVGLFESVVFDRQDASGNTTGFDFSYLNPIIFYRAVENSLGSPDNVLLGANWKWNFLQRFSFYGQLVLDELLVGEFIKATGWWGNKNALQLGVKYIDAFSVEFLDLQYEFNSVRPYTYAFEDNGGSYTHYLQSIAHPLGANFSEHIFNVWYQISPKIVLQNTLMSAVYGTDTAGSNWGGNIFLNYDTHEQEYNNFIGQGVKNNLLLNDLVLSWQMWHNIFLDGRCMYRKNTAVLSQLNADELYFGIGVRINSVMRNDYY